VQIITNTNWQLRKQEISMKKLMLQLFVIGSMIAAYALPVLAGGGGGP
jgi:hypothetical protein